MGARREVEELLADILNDKEAYVALYEHPDRDNTYVLTIDGTLLLDEDETAIVQGLLE